MNLFRHLASRFESRSVPLKDDFEGGDVIPVRRVSPGEPSGYFAEG